MIKKRKQDYIWNTTGSLIYALNSVILLMIVVQLAGAEQGGIFSIAYTISQTLVIIGCFEMKVFQVTDSGMYSFQEYFRSRVYTSGIMILAATIWITINHFEFQKAAVTVMLSFYKLSDSFGDVVEGYFQRTDRLYISGKLLSVRTGIPTIFFIIILLTTRNLLLSCFFLMLSAILFLLVFDFGLLLFKDNVKLGGANNSRVIKLLLICFPLFISSFLASYITNAPKYAIDKYLNEEMQTYYSVIFMPSFAINLLSGFAFKPLLVDATEIWNKGETGKILSIIFRMSVWILAITLICVTGGWLLGIPVLSLIYGLTNMDVYRKQLIIILFGGGVNAYNIFLYYMLTVMRNQKYILTGYILVFIEAVMLSNIFVKTKGIHGAAMSYLICSLSLGFIFIGKILQNIRRLKNKSG